MPSVSKEITRLLLIGAGTRGRMWAQVVAESPCVEIAAVVDPSPAAREMFEAEHPGLPWFAEIDPALAAERFDAAILVTPPDGHLAQCRLLFDAGLPVLAEKPLSTSLADTVGIIDAADASGMPLSVGLNFRYLPVSMEMRDWLRGERLGKVGFGQFRYLRNRDGRRPGINRYPLTMRHPMMLEQTIHHLDLIRFCHGREVAAIACHTWNPPWSMYAHDANVHCLLTLEDGAEVNYFGTWSGGWNNPGFEWRIDCTEGVIIQRELHSDLAYAHRADPDLTAIPLPDARPYYDDSIALLGAFLASLRGEVPLPCDGRDHLRSLALCFAGIESGETGRIIRMSDFYTRHGLDRLL
ncbi:Gfo/Idh/MocA family protein [Pseudotabrizicola algicola]|uniref:Gfo/Idh/MocA family oxidoreductase n=1 Tax=Pseudotabrizicola algicola TaxID=2709381 RepID=A0A6B3RKS1_9RHOB|nr:Gfo/Idh/MocA family oxidoreductase [Pseudotabrizicola algicola]NEX46640.1 Gfo/Idh/MocA family oxidoreductase [Pseudotabrizicola algicola]